jgi:predicted DNA binding CopG/RHH family protein
MSRKVLKMTIDEQAEAFLDQDLSDLEFAQFG